MKIPISKNLTEYLLLPCIAIVVVILLIIYSDGQKDFELSILIILLFGVPAVLFSWFLLDRRFEFKEIEKVRKADKFFQLPFSKYSANYIFMYSPVVVFTGILLTLGDNNLVYGIPILAGGLIIIILTAIAVEHPGIWFSDTINMIDLTKEIAETPKEDSPAYQDGIFTYYDELFDVRIDGETKTFYWDKITSIIAYKVDLLTVDSVVIEVYADSLAIKMNDQMAGSMKFMETAADKLENFREDWYMVVAFPAFETNLTIIYEKVD